MENINNFLKHQVDNGKTPSIEYIFFDSDTAIYELCYGHGNVKSNKAIDTTTTYNLYSITKTFTALSVLQLVEADKIDLKAPASNYLTDFPYSKRITVGQLLSHTAGIPNPMPLRWIHLADEHQDFNRNAFFRKIFRKHSALLSEPDTKFKYSNLGYELLGQLTEQVSGQSFENYVQEKIIRRCDIEPTHLGFQIDSSLHAIGYHKWCSVSNVLLEFLIDKRKFMGKREGAWKPFHYFYNNGIAYGGMIGSGYGLMKYAQTLLKDNSALLSDQYKKILFTENLLNKKPTGMSFSWYTGVLKGNKYCAHAGGGGGYYAELRIYPELHVGSVILYNRSGMTDERILNRADSFFISERKMLMR